jgi:hypothetical protein
MTLRLALALVIPLVTGFLFLCFLWPGKSASRAQLLLKVFLAGGLGLGISSVGFFLWLAAFRSAGNGYVIAEASLALCLCALLSYRIKTRNSAVRPELHSAPMVASRIRLFVGAAFCLALACSLITLSLLLLREPNGQYDAVAIWNLRARFIFRGGEQWTDAFSTALMATHPDYPLLLPLSVVRCWKYAGYEAAIVPPLIAMFFAVATIGLLVSAIATLRTVTQGFLAGLVLLAPFLFITTGVSENADTPLGFFLLAILVLLCLQDRMPDGKYKFLLVAGMMTGFAAWTKNEGWLFLAAVVIARFIVTVRGLRACLRQLLTFAIGLAPILLVVIYFKMRFAPSNDLVAAQGFRSTADKLLDSSRYLLILKAFADQVADFGGWYANPTYLLIFYPLCLGVRVEEEDRPGIATSIITLGLILTGYFFVYVTTPHDLSWHLRTSLDRLLIQLWPSFVFVYFLIVRALEQALHQKHRAG